MQPSPAASYLLPLSPNILRSTLSPYTVSLFYPYNERPSSIPIQNNKELCIYIYVYIFVCVHFLRILGALMLVLKFVMSFELKLAEE
jgi:hypothetical protein